MVQYTRFSLKNLLYGCFIGEQSEGLVSKVSPG